MQPRNLIPHHMDLVDRSSQDKRFYIHNDIYDNIIMIIVWNIFNILRVVEKIKIKSKIYDKIILLVSLSFNLAILIKLHITYQILYNDISFYKTINNNHIENRKN